MYSRHELVSPDILGLTVDLLMKSFPAETVLANPTSSNTFASVAPSGRFANSWSRFCDRSPSATGSRVFVFGEA